jgi:hypothetical protein
LGLLWAVARMSHTHNSLPAPVFPSLFAYLDELTQNIRAQTCRVDPQKNEPQALCTCPTRELVVQVCLQILASKVCCCTHSR